MNDNSILGHITSLLSEERRLRLQPESSELDSAHLRELAGELDQCWDLLRQRRAKREFGEDPAEATLRSAPMVKHYEG